MTNLSIENTSTFKVNVCPVFRGADQNKPTDDSSPTKRWSRSNSQMSINQYFLKINMDLYF